MSDIPELTDDEADRIRWGKHSYQETKTYGIVHERLVRSGLLRNDGEITPNALAALAAYDAKQRAKIEAPFRDLLREDAAGRSVAELLDIAADSLFEMGGGPVEDCLRLKASEIRALIAKEPTNG